MKQYFKKITFILCIGAIIINATSCHTVGNSEISIPKEKVSSFNYYNINTNLDINTFQNSEIAKLVEEYTGYKVRYSQMDLEASNPIMDIFMLEEDYQAVKVTKENFYTLLSKNHLKDLTYFIKNTDNLYYQISKAGWKTASVDGKIYGIPLKNATETNNVAIAFRLDWLNKYNEEHKENTILIPSEANGFSMTLSEFKQMLIYFKEMVSEDNKPMIIDMKGVYQESILPAFGVYQMWADVNGKLEYYIDQPGFEDYMNYMKDLSEEGLISYQATTEMCNSLTGLKDGMVGAGRVAHWNSATIEQSEVSTTNEKIGYIAALIPDECRGDHNAVRTMGVGAYSYYTVIPDFVTDEEVTMVIDWIDKKLDKEFFLQMVLGSENVTYTIEDDGYYPILPNFEEKQGIADKFLDGSREYDYSKYWLCRTRKTEAQDKLFRIANYNIRSTGIMDPVTIMPPNEAYDTLFPIANLAVVDKLVSALYDNESNLSIRDIQSVYEDNYGKDSTIAVNAWYSSWEQKGFFNRVNPR